MMIELTPDIVRGLTEEAHRRNMTPEQLALDYLRDRFRPLPFIDSLSEKPATALDMLHDFVGIIDSGEYIPGGARMSEDISRKFTEGLLKKHLKEHPELLEERLKKLNDPD
jgi:hypothetical protein